MRLHLLYAIAIVAIALLVIIVDLLREDCSKRGNELDRALCVESSWPGGG